MGVVVNLRPCVCGGKVAIIPHYSEAIDENGEYYEKVSYYCECTKCGISTPFMSCEEAAADCWEGTFATASGGGNREQKGVADVAEWR